MSQPQPGPSTKRRKLSFTGQPDTYEASGLKHTLHGVVYQVKLLMLFLKRALDDGYDFRLSTEWDAADKFDDLVFQYLNPTHDKVIHRFLQAKHKQSRAKKISHQELFTTDTSQPFCLVKYFNSYRKILKYYGTDVKNEIVDFIICTNIDLDRDDLKGVEVKEVTEPDHILNISNYCAGEGRVKAGRYRLTLDKNNEFYRTLKETSDLYKLAKEIDECVQNQKVATLGSQVFKLYHIVLADKVFIKENATQCKFRTSFFENDSKTRALYEETKGLRESLKNVLGIDSDAKLKKYLKNKVINVSKTFGKGDEIQSLPEDIIEDSQVEDFFEKLVFAVNQPDEVELGNFIGREVGDVFNLIDSEFITNTFESRMMDWVKTKEGTFFTNTKGMEMFEDIKRKVFRLALVGPTAEFCKKLGEYDVKFRESCESIEEMRQFLSPEGGLRLLHIVTGHPRLSTIKFLQVLQASGQYEKDDSYVFIPLSFFMRMTNVVLQAYSRGNFLTRLLIIEAEGRDMFGKIARELRAAFEAIFSQSEGLCLNKIILITANSDEYLLDFKLKDADEKRYTDTTNGLCDLAEETKRKVLSSSIRFQGKLVALCEVIDANLAHLIDEETLSSLLLDCNDFIIGEMPLDFHGYNRNYYVDREFSRTIMLDNNIFDSLLANDSSELLVINDEVKFQTLCMEHPESNVHFLERKMGRRTFWKRSRGSISKLLPYKVSIGLTRFGETELLNESVVVISDKAGMGKSTVLTSFCLKLKALHPSSWIIRINLNDYTDELEFASLKRIKSCQEVVSFLIQGILKFQTNFERNLFTHFLGLPGKVTFYFDGFDEISPFYKDLVLDLVVIIKRSYSVNLYLTTRPHMVDYIENRLGVFAYSLTPFSESDQHNFLLMYWKSKLKQINSDESEGRLKIFVDALIKKLLVCIKDKERQFTGVPLQMKMVADVFLQSTVTESGEEWKGLDRFLESNEEEPSFPHKLDLIHLYDQFIKNKFDIICKEKKKERTSNALVKVDNEEVLRKEFNRQHQHAALYAVLDASTFKKLLSARERKDMLAFLKRVKDEKDNRGIIDLIIGKKPQFIHRTVAEYLVADFLLDNILSENGEDISDDNKSDEESQVNEDVLDTLTTQILINEEFEVLRSFVNNKVSKSTKFFQKRYNNLWKVESCLVTVKAKETTVLHMAFDEANDNLIRFLLNILDNSCVQELVNVPNENGYSPLYRAAQDLNLELMNLLVEKGASVDSKDKHSNPLILVTVRDCFDPRVIEFLINKYAKITDKGDDEGKTVLHWAAERGNLDTLRLFINRCNVNAKDNYDISVLHYAIHSGNLDIVEELIAKGADACAKDENGISVLQYAAYAGRYDICKSLIEFGKADVHSKSNDNSTLLHEAAISGNLKLMQYLVDERHLDISARDNKGRSIVHDAAKYGHLGTVKFLTTEKGADSKIVERNGNTLLHEAAKYGEANLCEFLVDMGLDINTRYKKGKTALHKAVKYGNLDVVEWLLLKGMKANTRDDNGFLPIHESRPNSNIERKWNLSKYSEKKFVTHQDGIERLSYSTSDSQIQERVVKLLIEHGSEIDAPDSHGDTVLHWAVSANMLDLVDYLMKTRNPDLGVQDCEGLTPLDRTLTENDENVTMITVLLTPETDINIRNKEGRTLLHRCVVFNHASLVSRLIYTYNADTNIRDNNGDSALDLAIKGGNSDIIGLLEELNLNE